MIGGVRCGAFTAKDTLSSLSLHFDSGFEDATGKNILTPTGSASINASQSRFGGGSYSPGVNGILTGNNTDTMAFGLSDFCIEAWIYLPSAPSQASFIVDSRKTGNGSYTALWVLSLSTSSVFLNGRGTLSIPLNQWVHVAQLRIGTTLFETINGQISYSGTDSTSYIAQGVTVGCAGYVMGTAFFPGLIDEVRISKRTSRYAPPFTPPSAPFLP